MSTSCTYVFVKIPHQLWGILLFLFSHWFIITYVVFVDPTNCNHSWSVLSCSSEHADSVSLSFLEIIYMEVYRLMAAYAIIENGGKQYKVSAGDVIYVEKMDAAEGDKVVFDKVVFADGKIGAPYVDGVTVSGTVEKQGKEKKVVTFKYKPKKHSHKKQGHRQPYTKVVIDSIA